MRHVLVKVAFASKLVPSATVTSVMNWARSQVDEPVAVPAAVVDVAAVERVGPGVAVAARAGVSVADGPGAAWVWAASVSLTSTVCAAAVKAAFGPAGSSAPGKLQASAAIIRAASGK